MENNTLSNQETSSPIPWYRTRLFWGVIIGVLIIWGLIFYFLDLYNTGDSFFRILSELSISFGILPLLIIFGKTFVKSTPLLYVTYYFIMTGLLCITFHKKRVSIIYPIIFVTIFLTGHIIGVLFISSLY